jgi:uncharacterized Zn finger protein (UPF0148 family)
MDENKYNCPKCGKIIREGAPFCPHCGEKQTTPLSDKELSKNPYDILQVSEDAEPEVIDAAYRSLARKYHPDISKVPGQEDKMRDINWAHNLLSNPSLLAEWKRKYSKRSPLQSKSPKAQSYPEPRSTPPVKTPGSTPNPQNPPSFSQQHTAINKPSKGVPGGPLILIAGGILLLFSIIAIATSQSNSPISQAPAPTQTRYKTPTPFVRPTKTATQQPNCIYWTQLTSADVYKTRCVYGRIVKIYSAGNYIQVIRFSDKAGTFMIADYNYYFESVQVGQCVAVIGIVGKNESGYLMSVKNTELYLNYRGCP